MEKPVKDASAASESLAMKIILGGRSRDSLPSLTWNQWRHVAAQAYCQAVVAQGVMSEVSLRLGEEQSRWIRLLCGALTARALQQGWDDLAAQYHGRYWDRAEEVDQDEELQRALRHVIDLEDASRVAAADLPK